MWSGIDATSAARPFDFALDAGASSNIQHHTVVAGGLFITVQPSPTSGRVLIYRDIASTSADRPPDVIVEHPSLAGAREATVTAGRFGAPGSGVLLVLTSTGVSIFSDPFGTPTFKTRLTAGTSTPVDMLYLP